MDDIDFSFAFGRAGTGCCGFLSVFAATVTGTVTNKTVNKPSAGDDVVLIAFGQGMQEAGRTKTDAKGHYSLDCRITVCTWSASITRRRLIFSRCGRARRRRT